MIIITCSRHLSPASGKTLAVMRLGFTFMGEADNASDLNFYVPSGPTVGRIDQDLTFESFAIGGAVLKPVVGVVAKALGYLLDGFAAKGFYRAMSNAEYAALQSNNGLTHMAGKELFVSSRANCSRAHLQKSGYDILVQFNMKPGAMNYFTQVGLMYRTAAGASGWAGRGSLLWKSEQGIMNLGIQQNTHMFNPWINSFKEIK